MATMNDFLDYTTRIDKSSSATYEYFGESMPGTSVNDASTRIARKTVATGDVLYAGSGGFNQVWANRAALAYA